MRRRARSSSRRRAAFAVAFLPVGILLTVLIGPVAGAALVAVALVAALSAGMSRGGGIVGADRKGEVLRGQISRGARFDPAESAVYDEAAWARVRAERDGEQTSP